MVKINIKNMERIISIVLFIFAVFFDKIFINLNEIISKNEFFGTLLKYIVLYFTSSFFGEFASIIYMYKGIRKNTIVTYILAVFIWIILPLFIILPVFGILYSIYTFITKPFLCAVLAIFIGFTLGFQFGIEKSLLLINTNKIYFKKFEEGIDQNIGSEIIPYFIFLFLLFYPVDYYLENHIDKIAYLVLGILLLSVIYFYISNVIYKKISQKFDIKEENGLKEIIFYLFYNISIIISLMYFDNKSSEFFNNLDSTVFINMALRNS